MPVGPILCPALRVNAALADGIGYPINCQHIRCNSVVHAVSLRIAHHVLKRSLHDVLKLFVDHRLLPEIALAILHPLEVRGGHSASVTQDIWNDENFLFGQDLVSSGGGWAIRSLGEDFALHAVGIATGDLIFRGSRDENFTIGYQQFGGIVLLRAGKAVDRTLALAELPHTLNVDSVGVVHSTAYFRDADNFVTCLGHESRGI